MGADPERFRELLKAETSTALWMSCSHAAPDEARPNQQHTHEGNTTMKLLQAKQAPYVKAAKVDEDLPVNNRAAKRRAFATNNPRSVRKARK